MNPSTAPRRVYGRTAPATETAATAISNRPLGRLLKGLPAVRITNTTSVCVTRDSTNHPVRNSGALVEAWNSQRYQSVDKPLLAFVVAAMRHTDNLGYDTLYGRIRHNVPSYLDRAARGMMPS